MSLNYRSLFEVPTGVDVVALVRVQFRDWLRIKREDSRSTVSECDWDGGGAYRLGDSAWMTENARDEQDGSRLLRLTLEETNQIGRWVTDVTAAERPGPEPWSRFVWVETSSADAEGDGSDPKRPRIITNMLAEVVGMNGKARMSSRPYLVHGDEPGEVDDLVEVIGDAARSVPVVVGGGLDGASQLSWMEVVHSLTEPGMGLLSSVVLDDRAVVMLNERLGDAYAVQPGGVRTYHRGVRTDDRSDAIRHRFITPSTINRIVTRADGRLRVDRSIAYAIAWNARRAVLDAELPRAVRRVDAILRRESKKARLKAEPQTSFVERLRTAESGTLDQDARSEVPAPAGGAVRDVESVSPVNGKVPDADELGARLLDAVGIVFGTKEVSDTHVDGFVRLVSALARDFPVLEAENAAYEALLDDAARESEELREELEHVNARAAESTLDAAIAEEARRHAEREASWYRRQAIEAQRYEALAGPTEPEPPRDLSALLDLLDLHGDNRPEVVARVVFTGDRSVTEQLLKYDDHGRIAGTAWDVVLVLNDYAEARLAGETRNLHAYLNDPPTGRRALSRHRFRPTESQTVATNKKWRAERAFPVPAAVDPSCQVFMDAHFELGHGDTVAPRLHFHDAVDLDGTVYVGYIGRHLTNTMS